MESNRRHFLKIAGLFGLGLTAAPVLDAYSSGGGGAGGPSIKRGDHASKANRWGMVIDTTQFESAEDLEPIIEACHKAHNVPHFQDKRHEIKWIWETEYKHAFTEYNAEYLKDSVKETPFLVLCNHCGNPACVRACPTQATFKRETDGIVLMDFHRCIGCRFCMAACPFGARSFNFRDPRPFITERNGAYPTRMKGVVEKCNFCAERLAVGKQPACVEISDGAIVVGDLTDPDSEVRGLIAENYTIRRKQHMGTDPSIYYIV